MRRGVVRAGIVAGLVVCGALTWFVVRYVIQARDQSAAGSVVQGLAAALPALAAVGAWLVRHAWQDTPSIDLDQAADELASRVGRQWHETALLRGLFDRPLMVRWTWSSRGLSGPATDAVGDRRAPRISPLPGLSRIAPRQLTHGDLRDLFKIYGGLDSGRMLLVGSPGAGKTGAMIRLLLDAITHREGIRDAQERAMVPVPVLLTAYDWLPESEGLVTWVARRLQEEHPFLKAKLGSVSAARALVDSGAISVLIDGVDEMPAQARAVVLRQIGAQTRYRIVLSSRTNELARAVAGGHLVGAAALELMPVAARQAADYLQSRTVHPTPAPWGALLQHLHDHGTSVLAQALDSPLMLSLLLDTYLPFDPVDELTDPRRFHDREQIEDHLLIRVLSTAYTPRPGNRASPYTLPQAEQWLVNLAAQMNRTDTRDLAWWRIPEWLPRRNLQLTIGLTFGFTTALAFGLTFGLTFGLMPGLVSGLMSGVINGLAVVLTSELAAELTAGLLYGAEYGLAVTLVGGISAGLIGGLAVGLAVGPTRLFTRGLTNGFGTPAYDGFPPQYRQLKRSHFPIGDAAIGIIVGFVAALTVWFIDELLFPVASFPAGSIGVFMSGIMAGLPTGLTSALTRALNTSQPTDKLVTPIDSWRGNRRIVLTLALTAGSMVGAMTGTAAALITSNTASGVAFGFATGIASGLSPAATNINFALPAYVASILLHRAGHCPARAMGFLEDARSRGVLRTAGPVYQFRHARLQDLLASSATTQPALRPSTTTGSQLPA